MLRTLLRGLWVALSVVVALHLLHVGDSGVGLLQAAAAAGAVLAVSISATQIGRRRLAPACMIAFGLSGLAVSVVGDAPPYAVVLAIICGWGIAMAVADAVSMSMLHRLLDPRALFRTLAVMDSLKCIAEGIGALLAPALVALLGTRVALLISGLPLPVLMAATSRRMRACDHRAEGRGRLVGLLHGVSLFHGLDLASIEDLAARLRPDTAVAGQEIVTQGDPGDRFYVIAAGAVELLVDHYRIGELGPGGWFGERALLRDSPRTATVRALDQVDLQSLGQSDFLEAITGLRDVHPEGPTLTVRALRAPDEIPVAELLGTLTLLSSVDGYGLERLAQRSGRASFGVGEVVVAAGEQSDAMFVVLAGHAQVLGGDGLPSTTLHPGEVFGEIGVLHQTQRTRTVVAADDLLVLVVSREDVLEATGWQGRPTRPTQPGASVPAAPLPDPAS
jgi:CRP-like cAMP-binding protein